MHAGGWSYYRILSSPWRELGSGFFAADLKAAQAYALKHFDTDKVRATEPPQSGRRSNRQKANPVSSYRGVTYHRSAGVVRFRHPLSGERVSVGHKDGGFTGFKAMVDRALDAQRRVANPAPAKRKGSTSIQSLLFQAPGWTPFAAQKWAMEHGFKASKADQKGNFVRLRQKEPSTFEPGTLRTITLTTKHAQGEIKAITGVPKPVAVPVYARKNGADPVKSAVAGYQRRLQAMIDDVTVSGMAAYSSKKWGRLVDDAYGIPDRLYASGKLPESKIADLQAQLHTAFRKAVSDAEEARRAHLMGELGRAKDAAREPAGTTDYERYLRRKNPKDPVSKPGKYGPLYKYAITMTYPTDPGHLPETVRRWAYDEEHAMDKIQDELGEDGMFPSEVRITKIERVKVNA